MTLLDGSDAESPNGPLPGQIVAGYIGGYAAHVWTPLQWRAQQAEYLLPIWVVDSTDIPENAADACVEALQDLGVPEDCAYMLDAEKDTSANSDWVDRFANRTARHHYGCYPYASVDTIFSLPPRSGYIVADWTGQRHLYEHPFVSGTQYKNEPTLDLDVFRSTMRFWRNPNDNR